MRTRFFLGVVALGIAASPIAAVPAAASVASMTQSAAVPAETAVIQVAQRGAYRGGAARVNRNVNVNRNVRVNRNVNVYRGANVNRGIYRGRYVYRGGPWVRPRNYWWPVGGAVAAGAALGMITAAAAMPYAGPPPGAGYCWYYTDPTHTQGFWDRCP